MQVVKSLPVIAGNIKICRFSPWVGKIPWRRAWQLTPVCLPAEFHGQRSLVGYSPEGHKESNMTEHRSFYLLRLSGIKYTWCLAKRMHSLNAS